MRQLEDFARAVHVAVGYLFLPSPPQEPLPIPDFRTVAADREVSRPSPNLLDTIYLCQQRQDWFRDYARMHALPALAFVGSATLQDKPDQVAEAMRQTLALSIAERQRLPTWTDALRQLIGRAEDAGVLVMASGVVGSNSHRMAFLSEAQLEATLARMLHQFSEFWASNACAGWVQVRRALLAARFKGMGTSSALRAVQKPTKRHCHKVCQRSIWYHTAILVQKSRSERTGAISQNQRHGTALAPLC